MTLEAFFHQFGSGLSGGPLFGLLVALVGGIVASAVCPCTVPMGLGMASVVGASGNESRRQGFLVAAAFFGGIVVNLTVLGVLAAHLGSLLTESFGRYWTLTMAVISLLAAVLAMYGPRLGVDKLAAFRRPGALGAFGYGFVFSLGTSAAPLLLLLTVSAAQADPFYGLALAFAFGVGRGLPFLVVGVFAGAIVRFTRIGLWRRPIQVISAASLLLVSFYYARAFVTLG
jgi:cytochrome c-type biogenesis protein